MTINISEANQRLGEAIRAARELSILLWALGEGRPITSTADMRTAREEFYKLPYETRRLFHVRPTADMVTAISGRDREAARRYAQSGDARSALPYLDIPPDVEQKHNSRGVMEILECDLFTDSETPLETAYESAYEAGEYDLVDLPGAHPSAHDEAVRAEVRTLLVNARRGVPSRIVDVLVEYTDDGGSLRELAEKYHVSHESVRGMLDRAIAAVKRRLPAKKDIL